MKKTRTLAMTLAAGATLVAGVAMAGPASAVDAVNVTKLPANVTIQPGGSVSVNVPGAAVCAAGTSDFKAFVPGKQDAVVLNTAPGAGCSAGQLNYSIADNSNSLKKNAVVKFTAKNADGSAVVQTLVVHIKGQQLLGASNANGKGNGNGNGKGNS